MTLPKVYPTVWFIGGYRNGESSHYIDPRPIYQYRYALPYSPPLPYSLFEYEPLFVSESHEASFNSVIRNYSLHQFQFELPNFPDHRVIYRCYILHPLCDRLIDLTDPSAHLILGDWLEEHEKPDEAKESRETGEALEAWFQTIKAINIKSAGIESMYRFARKDVL